MIITHSQEDGKLLLQDVSKLLGTNPVFLEHIPVCSALDPPIQDH